MNDIVGTLSKRKQRRSVGEIAKTPTTKTYSGKPVTKLSAIRSNKIESNLANPETVKKIKELLSIFGNELRPNNRKVPLKIIRTIDKEKRPAFRREWFLNQCSKDDPSFDLSSYFSLRSSVVFGVNEVSKGLERESIVGVIIEEDVSPKTLTSLLIPIANSKCIPILKVKGLKEIVKESIKIKCIAIGFKVNCKDSNHKLYPLVQLISNPEETQHTPVTHQSSSHDESKTINKESNDSKISIKRRKLGTLFRPLKIRKTN